jgi:hypothetical protein
MEGEYYEEDELYESEEEMEFAAQEEGSHSAGQPDQADAGEASDGTALHADAPLKDICLEWGSQHHYHMRCPQSATADMKCEASVFKPARAPEHGMYARGTYHCCTWPFWRGPRGHGACESCWARKACIMSGAPSDVSIHAASAGCVNRALTRQQVHLTSRECPKRPGMPCHRGVTVCSG